MEYFFYYSASDCFLLATIRKEKGGNFARRQFCINYYIICFIVLPFIIKNK